MVKIPDNFITINKTKMFWVFSMTMLHQYTDIYQSPGDHPIMFRGTPLLA